MPLLLRPLGETVDEVDDEKFLPRVSCERVFTHAQNNWICLRVVTQAVIRLRAFTHA